jgi:predicted glycosyltransferase
MKYGNNMKYLDRFENHYLKLSEIILTLEDILLELKDEGIEWVLTPNNDIRKKILSMYLRDIVSRSGHTEFSLKFYVNSKLTD